MEQLTPIKVSLGTLGLKLSPGIKKEQKEQKDKGVMDDKTQDVTDRENG